MKYTEFVKSIANLGEGYLIGKYPYEGYYSIVYRTRTILKINTQEMFKLVSYNALNDCPKKQEVWNAATALAATPLDEREEEKKYNVIISSDNAGIHTAWSRGFKELYVLSKNVDDDSLEGFDYKFTESEFQNLLKYIKSLPQGDKQVEIAKIGKTLVND